jgi:hypothetical protein
MHVAGLAADVRFVHLNLARQLSYGPLLHGEPYAVHQEPSRFLGEGKEMGRDGRACAYLDLSRDTSKPESQVHRDPMVKELVEELRDRVAFLERSPEQRSVEAERYQQMVVGLTQTNNRLSATLEIRISRLPGTSKGQIPRASLDALPFLWCRTLSLTRKDVFLGEVVSSYTPTTSSDQTGAKREYGKSSY